MAGSLAVGSLAANSSATDWGFAFDNLALGLGLKFAMRFDPQTGFSFEQVNGSGANLPPQPVIQLSGLVADRVAVELGGLVTMEASQVGVHLDVFKTNAIGQFTHIDGEFLTFGGIRPTKPAATEDNPYPELVGGDGSISLIFGDADASGGNPLAGLGGEAGNFGIGWDPSSAIGFQLVPLNDFFVSVSIPEDFKFGFPDWLPLELTEIGLRFPETFGDLLPTGGVGNVGQAAGFALDALTNFSLVVSGGVNSQEDGWPIRGLVENLEIDIHALRQCAEYVWDNRASYADNIQDAMRNPDGSINPVGTLSAMALLGLELYNDPNCPFPITDLDAIDIGIEPFSIGPIEIGGGLGFGVLDVDIDTDEDGINDATSTVLFGRVEGQVAYSDIGIGVELIVTQYGPILARLFAGVPIPIGTLVGAIAGSIVPGLGTAAGAASAHSRVSS